MVGLHATERATIHLAVRARSDNLTAADIEAALQIDRTIVPQLAMRRTLFAFPRDLLPAVWGSASARTAATERKRMVGDLERAGVDRPHDWLDDVERAVLDQLDADGDLSARALRAKLPVLDQQIRFGSGKWAQEGAIGPRLLSLLGAEGKIVRGSNQADHWRVSRPAWATAQQWLGDVDAPLESDEGYRELVRRWLWTFGPGTEDDLVWWFGAAKTAIRAALASLDAVAVSLDDDTAGHGWLLPDDLDPVDDPGPWVALLPTLDSTTMGWKGRDFYLDPADRPFLFDTNGNAGTTAWVNGRIVGCYVQGDDGAVRVILRTDPARAARAALDAEAARLTEWLDGAVIKNVYTSPMMKADRLP